ncbi:MAG TPA: hypothetical protein PKK28_01575 [bacterium]|nr:hypothetical protein [bacterium]HOH85179.1 hypothetical protein [bacterium]HQB76683.1 hypothetical protein [bacterium]
MARQNKIESFFTKQDNHLSHEIDEAVVPVDGSLEKYTQPESFSPTEKAVDNSVANQDKSLAAQTNGQNSEKINDLRHEIASCQLSSTTVIEEPSVRHNSNSKFNPTEIFSYGQERFAGHLAQASLRTLIGYIEKSGIKIKNIKELSLADKKSLRLLKKKQRKVLLINPRLYFLSQADAGILATQELLKRLKTDQKQQQSI